MSPEKALAFSKPKVLRFWGLTGQRGWARLILGRLHDLVLSPGDFKGSTLDPSTVAHEYYSFFFPESGKCAAPFSGAEEQTTRAIIAHAQCACLFFLQMGSIN